jgi:hypothetical protein
LAKARTSSALRERIREGGRDVAIEDPLREAAARCLSVLLRYRNGDRTAATQGMMIAEIETIVGWLKELDLPPGVTETGVLQPVEEYLLARYGHEAGLRLNAEFVEAFEMAGMDLLTHGH